MKTLRPKTLETLLQIAIWQIGMVENPANSNKTKYGETFGLNGQPWCLIFIWWVFHEAGFNLYHTGSCTTLVNRYKANSPSQLVYENFQPGDIVFFDWSGEKKKTEHCGIVTAVNGSLVYTIEGNTSKRDDSNGGCVMPRSRNSKYITCAIRPKYNR